MVTKKQEGSMRSSSLDKSNVVNVETFLIELKLSSGALLIELSLGNEKLSSEVTQGRCPCSPDTRSVG